jgi:sugar fermentation stimulation protein A
MAWDVPFCSLLAASFQSRPNRFLVHARIGGRRVRAACRDPGRLRDLLKPGARLLLAPSADPRRRTRYTVVLVRKAGRWVSVIPALANRIFESALLRGGVPGLRGARLLAREVRHGRSRLDFQLRHRGQPLLVEVKSATLVEGRRALFPDAPTERGARHLRELTAFARGGGRASAVFVVQRSDARALVPHAGNDPVFAAALQEAARAGVRVRAYACRVTRRGVSLLRGIPVELSAPPPHRIGGWTSRHARITT